MASSETASLPRRIGQWLLRIASLFVLLEPIWMLLPFAGFLYGSVLRIENLNRSPHTAWLTHFVFPVLTLGWVGPAMVILGFLVFCVGAGQIYTAKIRRSGLVSNGLYRFVRHPQYIALTLFGGGLLLTWGRAIMFIAFFVMMFLYYYLSKSEEANCIRLFGEAYLKYREKTSFIFPGDRLLRPFGAKLSLARLPAPVRVLGAFVFTMLVCFGLMWLIQTVKSSGQTVPYLATTVTYDSVPAATPAPTIEMATGSSGGIPYVCTDRVLVTRGPTRNATVPGFAERVAQRLHASASLSDFLAFLDKPGGDVLYVFCAPYEKPATPGSPGMSRTGGEANRGPAPDPHGPERVRLVAIRAMLKPDATPADALADQALRTIRGALIAPVDLGKPDGEDIVDGEVFRPGPRFATEQGEDRWDRLTQQFAASGQRASAVAGVGPSDSAEATLVLVRAPVLRTRLDPEFAASLRDRLAASGTFRHQMQTSGCGKDVIAIAFPRPGPNWYREYHHQPQLRVFVMIARAQPSASLDQVISGKQRDLLGAFIADMDFAIEPPDDCVGLITPIGPQRDLEERWSFFTSGVGGATRDLHRH